MKTVSITVHNNKKLELFVEKHEDWFEVWIVGPIRKRRTLLDHHLTHDDLERFLEYAKPGDLVWCDAGITEIPAEKHRNAIEVEETIKQGTFWDFHGLDEMEASVRQALGLPASSMPSCHSVTGHLGAIALLSEDIDKTEWSVAKQAILGQWTDGVVTMSFEPDHKMRWSCADRQQPLNFGERVNGHAPDWWNFAMWGVALLNSKNKCGTHVSVLHVGKDELHIFESDHPHRMATVFNCLGRPEGITAETLEPMTARPKKVSRLAGIATPILRRLEQAVVDRNPLLAERLKPGLTESGIRQALNRANVKGAVEPIMELYLWRNGTALDEKIPMEATSFFPVDIYQFLDLETALNQLESMRQASTELQGMFEGTEAHSMFSDLSGQLFPLFSDGATGTIAVDLTPSKGNPVLVIELESTDPIRQAYGSFEEFIGDAIRANQETDALRCFQRE